MAREVIWAESAVRTLTEAADYIAHDSVVYAVALVNGAERAAESLTAFPLRGRMVPEYADPEIREVFVGSYRLIYRVSDETIDIVTFVHGARLLKSLASDPPGS